MAALRAPFSKRLVILILVHVVQIALVVISFPYIGVMSFAFVFFPPLAGGWLFGRFGGIASGLVSSSTAMVLIRILGLNENNASLNDTVGWIISVGIGLAAGLIRETVWRSQLAQHRQKQAEAKQQKLEKQLLQAQKMEAIGTLAGGVAHDMNNILGVIMCSASVLKQLDSIEESGAADVDNILAACRRGGELTRNLLGFARKGDYFKRTIDLNATVESAVALLRPIVSKNIRIETDLADDLHAVYADRAQLEQAIFNICINAAEAIEKEGVVSIKTANLYRHDPPGSSDNAYVVIDISDNGSGIAPDLIEHVFEPFFTTKEPGKGTGLGLSMAYGTINKHGGTIDIKSRLNAGTCLTIRLPADVEHETSSRQSRPSKPVNCRGTILLVDDEPLIRTSNKRLLQKLGYNVVLAESGEKALALYRDHLHQPVLVILDLVMPGMDGAETFEKLREIDKDAKVLISSGYSKDGKIDTLLKEGAVGFIQKPFDLDQLNDVLRTL